jgi:hypothetical protein
MYFYSDTNQNQMTMRLLSVLISFFLILGMASCGDGGDKAKDKTDKQANVSESKSDKTDESAGVESVTIDLTEMSVPLKLTVPEGVEVREGMMMGSVEGVMNYNYELVKDGWIIDVSMIDEDPYTDKTGFIADQRAIIENSEDFEEIVKESDNGFIYKTTNADGTDYNFYYVYFKDNRAFEFSAGLKFENFTLSQVKSMYEAAQSVE